MPDHPQPTLRFRCTLHVGGGEVGEEDVEEDETDLGNLALWVILGS